MKLSVALNEAAQAYAEELARIDNIQLTEDNKHGELEHGENLATAWSPDGEADYTWATEQDRI